jgi:hypothetical protein
MMNGRMAASDDMEETGKEPVVANSRDSSVGIATSLRAGRSGF